MLDFSQIGLDSKLRRINMETKSRYEVIAELEAKKRELILQRDGLDKTLKAKQRQVLEMKRQLEDEQDEVKEFESSLEMQKETFETLIKSIDESLQRFSAIKSSKSQKK